ncbi:MAG TPA: hypothetical protein V6C86_19005 [Oculatellaceae cyanobacterium]
MRPAIDTSSLAESAALQYCDMATVRRRLIELERQRVFSDEELAVLVRKTACTNLKADFEHRMFNHKMRRAASDRTSSGRVVIRSWTPTVVPSLTAVDDNDGGWKVFEPDAANEDSAETSKSIGLLAESLALESPASFITRSGGRVKRLTPEEIRANIREKRSLRPNKLKRMQSRNIILTLVANLMYVPRQLCSNLLAALS